MSLKDIKHNRPGMARVGKIRLGYMLRKCTHCSKPTRAKFETCEVCGEKNPAPEKKEMYPSSTPHFVLDDVPELVEVYGQKPTFLNLWFPFNSLEECMPSAHKLYSASSLLCSGDGEKISYAINAQSGRPIVRDGLAVADFEETALEGARVPFHKGDTVPCPGYNHDLYRKCGFCRPARRCHFPLHFHKLAHPFRVNLQVKQVFFDPLFWGFPLFWLALAVQIGDADHLGDKRQSKGDTL